MTRTTLALAALALGTFAWSWVNGSAINDQGEQPNVRAAFENHSEHYDE
ncbi:hypothetical protein [Streptomyces sp. CBMA152]|nr:hypothetical protein [Streptomyces sp. CBMA152]